MSAWWNVKGRRRAAEAAARQAQAAEIRARLRGQLARAEALVAAATGELQGSLDHNARRIAELVDEWARPELAGWNAETWGRWSPDSTFSIPELRVGTLRETETDTVLDLPVVVPVHGQTGAVVIVSRSGAEQARAAELLRALVVRASACFPKQVRIALLDPLRRGTSFPMSRRLERVLLGFDDPEWVLDELAGDVARIESSYLDRHHPTFEHVPVTLRLAESSQLLFAASFPAGYSPRATEMIVDLAERGSRAGLHSILHVDLVAVPEASTLVERLADAGATVLELGGTPAVVGGIEGLIEWDEAPTGVVEDLVFQRIATTPRRDVPVRWDDIQDLHTSEWWQESSDELIAAPVGRAGADQVYELWFGAEQQLARACTHGLVVGASAAARASFLDSFLAALTVRYSPAELRVVLVEGPDHPTFEPWRRLPHADIVALRPSAAQARSVVASLRAQAESRLQSFDRNGIASYQASRPAGGRDPLPRILAVIDGAEQVMGRAPGSDGASDLQRLLEIGERAGIHVLLSCARFDALGELHRSGAFGRIDLRVALQTAPDDAMGRDEFGLRGIRLVDRVCDRPNRAVVNAMRGHDDGNLAVLLSSLDAERRSALVLRLTEWAKDRGHTSSTVVVNGAEQPRVIDNPYLTALAATDPMQRAERSGQVARAGGGQGGLGIDTWDPSEHPRLVFVGPEDSVGGQAHFVLRRRPTENVAVVMADRDLRAGTLAGLLLSTVLTSTPDDLELWVVDRSSAASPTSEAIGQVVRRIASLDVPCRLTRAGEEAAEFIAAIGAEIGRRRSLAEPELDRQPTVLLVLSEPERIAALTRVPTPQGVADAPLGLELRYALMQGPAVGVHTVVVSESLGGLRTVLADAVVHQEFRHRLVTRVSDDDSFALVRSSLASTLGTGTGAAGGVLFDAHTQATTVFRPYAATAETARHGGIAAQAAELLDPLVEQLVE